MRAARGSIALRSAAESVMRLVRYLIVLIVLLSTSAWAAPTQPELPGAWARAALHTLPRSERDLKVLITPCAVAPGAAAPRPCASPAIAVGSMACARHRRCPPWNGHGGVPGGLAIRGQINVAFSNEPEPGVRLQPHAWVRAGAI
ncbi:hypothetical protein Xcc3_01170 [Xanthomonas campestris pv. campestris]|nr:hypothetical protein Xcc3_01170 [Xanthomonas campestris pv. campestris]